MLVYKYRFIFGRYLFSLLFSVAELPVKEKNPSVKQQDFTVNVLPCGHS